ncbi:HAMP domain-containing sensor histidine kinase [Novosphingobium sp. RD2P27]|uniref:histidine kinase n=1 Tax=Novosphingobium kalidii TaxID=3230299 RepID=A0ABV2D1Y9_9SPHN
MGGHSRERLVLRRTSGATDHGGWLNSIQAHMIIVALGTIITLTVSSIMVISLIKEPARRLVTVYEMSRIVRGLELAAPSVQVVTSVSDTAPLTARGAEPVLAELLAARLNLPRADVRIRLTSEEHREPRIRQEASLYRAEGSANPAVGGGFTLYIRQTDGSWNVYTRQARKTLGELVQFMRYIVLTVGLLIVLPLAMAFSFRLSRPVRAFAAAADRIGAGNENVRVPEVGPTEIRQAAMALNAMQGRVARSIRERTALVGAIAHDLRTPLSNLRFRTATMEPEARAVAEAEILQMERLISSTLDYVDGEGGTMQVEPLDLGSLLQTLADTYRDRGAAIEQQGHDAVTIDGDLVRLERLFRNLIENGLKYGHSITLSWRIQERDAIVDVVDQGPGMPQADLSQAFDPFFRGERSRNRSTGGIGLGLAIAQAAARAHGGTIVLENLPGGFRSRVTLPLARMTTRTPPTEGHRSSIGGE